MLTSETEKQFILNRTEQKSIQLYNLRTMYIDPSKWNILTKLIGVVSYQVPIQQPFGLIKYFAFKNYFPEWNFIFRIKWNFGCKLFFCLKLLQIFKNVCFTLDIFVGSFGFVKGMQNHKQCLILKQKYCTIMK